jgi:hypothetical protein
MRFILTLFLALAAGSPASAQEFTRPVDDVEIAVEAELPPIPAGWESVRGPFVVFHGPAEDLDTLLRLSRHAEEVLPQLSRDLKVPLGGMTHVYLAESDAQFRQLQPGRAPTWAEGVAYPSLGLVLLRSPGIRSGTSKPLEQVLRHELVHILLGRAFLPTQPPSWLQEGLAQVWADEVGPETTRTLSQGLATGSLMSLSGLSRGFPADPVRARLAYAQSADFIGWLRDEYGTEAVGELIRQLSHGAEIEGAIHSATGDFIEDIDQRWRGRLESSWLSLGVFANADMLFGLAGILLVVGGVSRRRRFHQRLAEMEAEEAALDALIAGYFGDRRDLGVH